MVRIVNSAIYKMDLTKLISRYKGGGTSAYHPIMILKALVQRIPRKYIPQDKSQNICVKI